MRAVVGVLIAGLVALCVLRLFTTPMTDHGGPPPASESVIAAALTLTMFAMLAVTITLAAFRAFAHECASTGSDWSIGAARELAARARRYARLMLGLCTAAVVVGVTIRVSLAAHVVLACWPAPFALYAVSLGERSMRAVAGDRATASGNYVHVWRENKLLAWFRVRPSQLAELALPRARAMR